MDLHDKCAVVTGGGHGIGRALAERLASEGAKVVVADLHAQRAEKVARNVGGLAVTCDVGDPAAVHELVQRATTEFGPVRVFCSNAGINDIGPDLRSTPEQVRAIVDVNLLAHVWAAQEVVPQMLDQGEGYLVQTLSSAALITGPSNMAYTMTKHGGLGFAEWLALNYAHRGIRVCCICPNAVNTGMLGRDEDDEARSVRARRRPGDRQHRRRRRARTVRRHGDRRDGRRPVPRAPSSASRRVVRPQGGRLRPLAGGHQPSLAEDARRGAALLAQLTERRAQRERMLHQAATISSIWSTDTRSPPPCPSQGARLSLAGWGRSWSPPSVCDAARVRKAHAHRHRRQIGAGGTSVVAEAVLKLERGLYVDRQDAPPTVVHACHPRPGDEVAHGPAGHALVVDDGGGR